MTRWICGLLFAAFALCFGGVSSYAQTEVVTECPAVAPQDGKTPIAYAELRHSDGGIWGFPGPSDVERREGRRVYSMDSYEASGFRRASLLCAFGEWNKTPVFTAVVLIPGLLLKCEAWFIPQPKLLPPRYIRDWCTSRVE
ncbi:MAG: hypothetical protein LCH62_04245 [Proteobacteria bacterium]|nr:hypothetical protein [Pseudomonadota bacterium]